MGIVDIKNHTLLKIAEGAQCPREGTLADWPELMRALRSDGLVVEGYMTLRHAAMICNQYIACRFSAPH